MSAEISAAPLLMTSFLTPTGAIAAALTTICGAEVTVTLEAMAEALA